MIKAEDEPPVEEEVEEETLPQDDESDAPALLGLCGEINEESLQDLSAGLIAANHNRILDIEESEFEGDVKYFLQLF